MLKWRRPVYAIEHPCPKVAEPRGSVLLENLTIRQLSQKFFFLQIFYPIHRRAVRKT